jgi:hypothetical protein
VSEFNFNIGEAFKHLHDRFDRLEDNVQEVRDKTIDNNTKLGALIGNGQKGKIDKIEDRLASVETFQHKSLGAMAAVGSFVTLIGVVMHYLLELFKSHH